MAEVSCAHSLEASSATFSDVCTEPEVTIDIRALAWMGGAEEQWRGKQQDLSDPVGDMGRGASR